LPRARSGDDDDEVTAEIRHRPLPHAAALDNAARRIIGQLQADGRRSYAAIAKAVGLSEAAVRQRIQRLVEGGVIRIVAVTDPHALGLHRQAMVGVRAEGDLRALAEELVRVDEVDDVVITAGSFDLLVAVSAADDDHLLRVLDEGIRRVPGVRETETFVYLQQSKHTYPWV
jgi:Lrp/AsnC family transcriptional regulator for asnA, asnC and gidA